MSNFMGSGTSFQDITGGLGDLFGTGSSGSTTGSGSETTTIERDVVQDTLSQQDSIAQALQQLMGRTSGTVQRGTGESDAATAALIQQLMGQVQGGDAAIEQARSDVQPAVQALVQEVIAGGMPQVYDTGNIAGGYQSTAAKQIQDQLVTTAAQKGVALEQEAVGDARQTQQQQTQALLQAITAAQAARQSTEEVTEEEQRGVETGSQRGIQESTLDEDSTTQRDWESVQESESGSDGLLDGLF